MLHWTKNLKLTLGALAVMATSGLLTHTAKAVVSEESELFAAMTEMDKILFEQGFNQCDLAAMEAVVHEDFEFYHDVAGTQDKAMFMDGIKKSICSTPDAKPIRKLVPNSMRVFKMMKHGELYGAIQSAEHEFYIKEPNKELYLTSTAKFTHVWTLVDGQWMLKESLSFEHVLPSKNALPPQMDKLLNARFKTPLFDKQADIERLLKQHNLASAAIGYIDHGKLQQVRVFGNQRLDGENSVAASHDTIYKVASLTKPVVALLTMKLVDDGQWDLDKPIVEYYAHPAIKDMENLKKLTTRYILSHKSGFTNWRHLKGDADSELTFDFAPGTQYQYSGEGFEYLRMALEHVQGKALADLAEQWVFEPLDMKDTHFYWDGTVDENRFAVEHDENGAPLNFKKHTKANAAANLLTTIEDYGKFMVHVMHGAGISEALYADMNTAHTSVSKDLSYGLGWEILRNVNGEELLQHTGSDYGVKTIAIIAPESQQGIVLFTNSERGIVLYRKVLSEHLPDKGHRVIEINLQR